MQRKDTSDTSDTIGAIAWHHLAIADIDDHQGDDPRDSFLRSAIRSALNAAYSAGRGEGLDEAHRLATREQLRAYIDRERVHSADVDECYGTTGGAA